MEDKETEFTEGVTWGNIIVYPSREGRIVAASSNSNIISSVNIPLVSAEEVTASWPEKEGWKERFVRWPDGPTSSLISQKHERWAACEPYLLKFSGLAIPGRGDLDLLHSSKLGLVKLQLEWGSSGGSLEYLTHDGKSRHTRATEEPHCINIKSNNQNLFYHWDFLLPEQRSSLFLFSVFILYRQLA